MTHSPPSHRSRSSRRAALFIGALLAAASVTPSLSTPLDAQSAPVIETSVPFDSAGRITTITPTLAARLGLAAPVWPVTGAFREARIYRGDNGTIVLAVQRMDATVARFTLDEATVSTLRRGVDAGLLAVGRSQDRLVGAATGLEVSQPAGNIFVRNQTFLGLAAYGPAAAAMLSDQGGPSAAGAYFLAAGASFFVAARTVRNRTVTRAQALRSAHGGTRGAVVGLGIAAIADADGAPARGAAVLAGAIGGTVAGYLQARGLSDGEAASAGLFADLGAVTTVGIAAASGVFKGRTVEVREQYPGGEYIYQRTDNSLRGPGKAAVGAGIGAGILGYALGPRYARLASYNVTSGDASMVMTTALLTAAGFSATANKGNDRAAYGAATAGLLAGALLADRVFVRQADRSNADGTLAQLGGLAGGLMGVGVAAMADGEQRALLGLGSVGGLLGLLAADHLIAPAADAGPLRGVLQRQSSDGDSRFSLSVGPVTSLRITF